MLKVVVWDFLAGDVAGSEACLYSSNLSGYPHYVAVDIQEQGETLLVRLTAEVLEAGRQQHGWGQVQVPHNPLAWRSRSHSLLASTWPCCLDSTVQGPKSRWGWQGPYQGKGVGREGHCSPSLWGSDVWQWDVTGCSAGATHGDLAELQGCSGICEGPGCWCGSSCWEQASSSWGTWGLPSSWVVHTCKLKGSMLALALSGHIPSHCWRHMTIMICVSKQHITRKLSDCRAQSWWWLASKPVSAPRCGKLLNHNRKLRKSLHEVC